MPDYWKYSNYAVIAVILSLAAYFVIADTNSQITAREETDLKDRVAQNSQYPQLVAGVIGKNGPSKGQRICPAGSAQLASSDHDCNFCHKIADGIQKFSDATHDYSFIAGANTDGLVNSQAALPFTEPLPPGYTVEPFPDAAAPGTAPVRPAGTPPKAAAVPLIGKMLQEGHWIGLEVGPLTPALAAANGIPSDIRGVLVDEVTLLSASAGILAGDVITEINAVKTVDLNTFKAATRPIALSRTAEVTVFRGGKYQKIAVAGAEELGLAQMEGAPMIRSNATSPHSYYGPCEKCHAITKTARNTGQMAKDGGDILTRTAPPIRWGQKPPHGKRGICTTCHTLR